MKCVINSDIYWFERNLRDIYEDKGVYMRVIFQKLWLTK